MFRALGVLIGCALRTGVVLALDMPAFCWKQLVGQRVEAADLRASWPTHYVDLLDFIVQDCKEDTEEVRARFKERTAAAELNWTTFAWGGSKVELAAGGAERLMHFDDRHEYCRAAVHHHREEG